MANRLFRPTAASQTARAYRIVKNSEVLKVGGFITDEGTGVADIDAVTEAVLGLVTGFVTKSGTSVDAVSSGSVTGYVASTKTFTAPSDNETVQQTYAEFIPVHAGDEFVVALDADKGTTTGSNLAGYYLALLTSDEALLDESTASTTITNTQAIIVDPLLNAGTRDVVVRFHLLES